MVDGGAGMSSGEGRGRSWWILGVWGAVALAVGVLGFLPDGLPYLSFLGSAPFGLWIRGACLAAFVFLLFKKVFRLPPAAFLIRLFFLVLFLPVILLPVFRCFFKVPFVFCRACPDRCPWGIFRTFILSSAVLVNLPLGRLWCSMLCPVGSFQQAQSQTVPWHVRLAPALAVTGYLFLLLVTGLYLLTVFHHPWVRIFETGWYAWGMVAVSVMVLILVGAFFIPRFWCRYFCPVGAVAELVSVFSKKDSARATSTGQPSSPK